MENLNDENYLEISQRFLDMLIQAKSNYELSPKILSDIDKEVSSIEHMIEFNSDGHIVRNKLAKRLEECLKRRRKIKNKITYLHTINTFISKCKKGDVIIHLQNLVEILKKMSGSANQLNSTD